MTTDDDGDGDVLLNRRAIQFFWEVTPFCVVNSPRLLEGSYVQIVLFYIYQRHSVTPKTQIFVTTAVQVPSQALFNFVSL